MVSCFDCSAFKFIDLYYIFYSYYDDKLVAYFAYVTLWFVCFHEVF